MKWKQCVAAAALTGVVQGAASWKFDFGSDPAAEGWTRVRADERFSEEKGYGFDLSGSPSDRTSTVTSEGGFYFSVALPPGNYHVRVKTGDPEEASDTTIKAESRRLMLLGKTLDAGESGVSSFTVNVRTPSIGEKGRVKLKDREKPYLHWDGKLTLEFNGERPSIDALLIEPAPDATTVFLLGDSTVTDQPYEPWNSWGQMLPLFFDDEVAVANHAESGESVRSSLGAGRFQQVDHFLKPGDYVLIQFGHNDMKDKRPDALEIYRKNLTEAVATIRKKGGKPVLVTSMERKSGVKGDTLGGYPDAVREVAKETETPLIDLHQMSRTLYQGLGDRLGSAFQDGTHHNNYGSWLLARCVVEGIRGKLPELAEHLREDAGVLNPASPPAVEEFVYPSSPVTDLAKPDGD